MVNAVHGCVLAYFLCEHHVNHVTSDVTEASFKSSTLIFVLLHQRRLLTLQRPQPFQHRTRLRRTGTHVFLQHPNTNRASEPRCHTFEKKPPPQKFISSRYVLDLWTLTLKTFSAIPTHTINTYCKFHLKTSTTCISSLQRYAFPRACLSSLQTPFPSRGALHL